MFEFRLVALNTAEATSNVLAAWELAAFFLGEAKPSDLPVDEDQAREWYIEKFVDEDSQPDYLAEPNIADAEMFESFTTSLQDMAERRAEELGEHYPFELGPDHALIRKNISDIGPVGASYMLLQFYKALDASTVEIDGANDAEIRERRDLFQRKFRNVFEYIAGYAVAGSRNGSPYMTSHCRSAKRLEALLGAMCRKVGAGVVLPYDHWNVAQKAANDGGVDCVVHIGGPGMPGDAQVALVGATVQKSDIGAKIMSPDKSNFFRSFFTTQPAAFMGILVRPQEEDALTKEKCVQKDCLLFSYEQIWRSMGKREAGDYQKRMTLRLDAKARKLLNDFIGTKLLHEFDEHPFHTA